MTIRQSRYILAETDQERRVRVTEVQRAEEDPFIRKSEIQQTVNSSTLPVSSRAVNLAIESINSDLDLKADKTELEGLATEDYVNEKIDEKEIGITETELISKSVGSDKWMREGAYGLGALDNRFGYHTGDLDKYLEIPSGIVNGMGGGDFNAYYPAILLRRYSSNTSLIGADTSTLNFATYTANLGKWVEGYAYSNLNTFPDSNGVLHNSRNPLNTLNTSDMADTVVDNDLLTVTSGAVFRAIKQLTDQIISLEARVRELEDGGI